MEQIIKSKLSQGLKLEYLKIIDESYKHQVLPGAQSHFQIIVVSDDFLEKTKVEMHQVVYKLLKDELQSKIHALSIVAMNVQEWKASNDQHPKTPDCAHTNNR